MQTASGKAKTFRPDLQDAPLKLFFDSWKLKQSLSRFPD